MATFQKAALRAIVITLLGLPASASAVELIGAWAPDADKCDEVFVRRGRAQAITFARYPGIHGGGFIIDADRLRGKYATCKIKTRKQDGDNLNLIAACATDIMYSNVQFVLKIVDENTVTRVFPGIEGMEVKYHRCQI